MGVLSLLEDAKKKAQANFKVNTGSDLNAKNVAKNLVQSQIKGFTDRHFGTWVTPTRNSQRAVNNLIKGQAKEAVDWAGGQLGRSLGNALAASKTENLRSQAMSNQAEINQKMAARMAKAKQEGDNETYSLLQSAQNTAKTYDTFTNPESIDKAANEYKQGIGDTLKGSAKTLVSAISLPATLSTPTKTSVPANGEALTIKQKILSNLTPKPSTINKAGISGALTHAGLGMGGEALGQMTQNGKIDLEKVGKRGSQGVMLDGLIRPGYNAADKVAGKVINSMYGVNTNALAKAGIGKVVPKMSEVIVPNAIKGAVTGALGAIPTSAINAGYNTLENQDFSQPKSISELSKTYLDKLKTDLPSQVVVGGVFGGALGALSGYGIAKNAQRQATENIKNNQLKQEDLTRMRKIAYERLGVNDNTTPEELHQRYRELAAELHPDRNGGDDTAFRQMQEAYEFLRDGKPMNSTYTSIYQSQGQPMTHDSKSLPNNKDLVAVMAKHGLTSEQINKTSLMYNDAQDVMKGIKDFAKVGEIIDEVAKQAGYTNNQAIIVKKELFEHMLDRHPEQFTDTNGQLDPVKALRFVKTINFPDLIVVSPDYFKGNIKTDDQGNVINKLDYVDSENHNISVIKKNTYQSDPPNTSSVTTDFVKNKFDKYLDKQKNTPDTRVFKMNRVGRQTPTVTSVSPDGGLHLAVSPVDQTGLGTSFVNNELIIPQNPENVKTQNANIADVATETPDNPVWQTGNEQNKLFEVESYSPTENEISEAKQYLNKQGIFSQNYYDKSKESFINQLLNPEDEKNLVDKQTVDELISHGYLPKNLDPNIDVDEMDKDLIKSLRDMGLLKSTKTDDIYSIVEKAAGKYYDDNTNRRLVETARQLQNEVSAENPQNIVIGNATTTPSNNTIQQTETIANNPQNLDIPEDWIINPEEYKVKNDIGTIDTDEEIEANLKFYQQNRPKTKAEAAKQEASALINPLKFLSERDKQATDNWRSEILTSRVKADQIAREIDDQLGNPDPETAWKITQYMQHPTKEFADQIGLENPEQYDEAIASMRQMYDGLREEVSAVTGRPIGYLENYVPQQWADSDAKVNEVVDQIARSAGNRPNYANERVIPDYQTGISYGLTPKYTHPGQLMAEYYLKSQKAMANNELIQDLLKRDVITTSRYAPAGYKQLTIDTLPTGGKKAYAPAQVATVLNNLFGEGSKGSATLEKTSNVNRVMQNVQLSGGIPKTPLNSFTFGQAIKEITGGNFKVVKSLARSMSNEATENFMQDHQDTIELMAQNGINMGGGDYRDEFVNAMGGADVLQKSMGEKGMDLLDRWFEEPTFKRFIPMKNIEYFETVYDNALQNGATQEEAAQTASDLTKTWMGMVDNYARDKKVSQTINSVFFAPAYREGMLHFWKNVGSTLIDAVKSGDYSDPQTQQMLKFTAGTAITYGLYNVANKLLTGHFMWENKPGKKFSLEIPEDKLPGGEIGRSLFTGILPSSATMPRNAFEIGLAMLNGDGETVKQKVGSYFSPMVKLGFELAANQDYFGNQIRNPNDSVGKQIASTAGYIIGDYTHPYIGGAIDFATNRRNGLETGLKLAETPFYGSRSSDTVDLTKKEYQTYKNVYQSAGKQKAQDYATQIKDINQKEKSLQKQEEQFSSGEGKIKQQSWWDKLWHKQPEVFTPAETPQLRSKQKAQIKSRLNMLDDTVSSDELNFYYLYDVSKMPENTRYERSKKQNEFYGVYKKILEDEVLNDEQKESLLQNVREGLGRSEAEMSYYLKASAANNDLKTEIVYDDLEGANFANHQDVIDYLVQMRKTLDGKQLATDGVLKNLYENGVISQSEYKYLKNLTWDENLGDFKSASSGSSSKSGKKSGKSTKNASASELASRLRSIRISSPTIPRITIGSSNYTPLKVASNLSQVAPIRIGEPVVDPEAILKAAG